MSEVSLDPALNMVDFDASLSQQSLLRGLKNSNAELEETIADQEKAVSDLENIAAKLEDKDFQLSDVLDNPQFERLMEIYEKKETVSPPTLTKVTKSKRRRTSKRVSSSSVTTPDKISLSKLASSSHNKRVHRTRYLCKSEGIRISNKFFFRCIIQGCPFEDYTESKMKKHYEEKHSLEFRDVPLPIYELQLQDDYKRRQGGRPACTRCKEVFKDEDEMSYHIRQVHVPQSYMRHTCVACDKKFVLLDDLKNHQVECTAKMTPPSHGHGLVMATAGTSHEK